MRRYSADAKNSRSSVLALAGRRERHAVAAHGLLAGVQLRLEEGTPVGHARRLVELRGRDLGLGDQRIEERLVVAA